MSTTREQLLIAVEDEVQRVVAGWSPLAAAVAYKYQFAAGMRIADADRIIRRELDAMLKAAQR